MGLNAKQWVVTAMAALFFAVLLIVAWVEGGRARVVQNPESLVTGPNEKCVDCHEVKTPGIVGQWHQSKHSQSGIGCVECHQAEAGDIDGYNHEGMLITAVVSPKDCSKCHEREFKEFEESHHAEGGKILGSLDNVLAEVVEGHVLFDHDGNRVQASAAAVSGCLQCHGSEIKVLEDGKLHPDTWPNTGIGRINPDGSKGSCSACHLRHDFDLAQARMPENCGRCHLGPDHPQLEVYNESKHGIAFAANRIRFTPDMSEKDWLPGVHYEQGPTCSSCHMSATRNLPVTHDVGSRISWTLRPPVSEKIDAAAKKQGLDVKSWEDRRADMKDVCTSCHGPRWVENWYEQYDNLVVLYNEKFGKPATALYKAVRAKGLISADVTFDDSIEFTYFFLWHHEGRRARHGAAMMGPDYTQWHGMYEVAHRFYMEFVPELKEIIEAGYRSGDPQLKKAADEVEAQLDEVLNSEMHQWFLGRMSPNQKAAREKARSEFQKRYAGD
ncbi:MAG: hydroxylamine oxidoreductase [Acidobacteria bacterium]|nr:hydroxylamine oxidoreductase [Acidobacteriota bacterium]